MTDRELAIIIYNALLAIAAGIRKKYGFPDHRYRETVIIMQEKSQEITLPEPAAISEFQKG